MTFFLAAAAAASAVYWLLRWPVPAPALPAASIADAPPAIDARRVARLLGDADALAPGAAPSGATAPASQLKLLGVVATGDRRGSALIANGTAPAKPYRVGEWVTDKLLLQSVSARSVVLAEGVAATGNVTVSLPAPAQ